ncbi:MAG: hypothetical protein ACUBOA_08275 [Candidatus Loosdrechtia sp.]|uniref:hypothetical protein n=1 Tax=Candidatus Loosdrechtia sp. TaxID=3101272 RepID=UPI003A7707C8|nr:MAG: hypothetical protein QY305_06200 [Candidatus Jettenia sp. AMX2]
MRETQQVDKESRIHPDLYAYGETYVLGKEFDLTEKDHEKAQRQVKRMAHDLYTVYKAFESHNQVKHYESFKVLETVFHQQCEVVTNKKDEPYEIVIREEPVGDEIISSWPITQ